MIYYNLGAICNPVLNNEIINVWAENIDEHNSSEVINWSLKQG